MKLAVLLFDDFETLDVYGPVEIFGRLTELYTIRFFSLHGGLIKNRHGVQVITEQLDEIEKNLDIFLIPGGYGTRIEVNNMLLIEKIREVSNASQYVLTVCTGTALLAKTGLLDGRKATSNKRAFTWVMGNGEAVQWDKKARWVIDGKYYTSSGVSAGMDMSLDFLKDRHGVDLAKRVAVEIEYIWNRDKDSDTFIAE